MTFEEIINNASSPSEIVVALQEKNISLPQWHGKDGLKSEYEPKEHPVMNKAIYPDIVKDGDVERVTRVTFDLQRLAVKRMTELCCGIPVKRIYKPENDKQKEVAALLEAIYQRNRIDSVNIERLNMLFASCEVATLWYATETPNNHYGRPSKLKLRCRNFTPMNDDILFPLFDEYGDMIAFSVAYKRKVGKKTVDFFDTYSEKRHMKFSNANGEWEIIEDEEITLLKIPAVYMYRQTPIWEDTSKIVYEMEWALSRNGNYLRKNSKPLFVVSSDEDISYGGEKNSIKEFRAVLQLPKEATASYVTWTQAVDNLKFYINELRAMFFTQLQLPDWSYEKMSQQALSGESRKQLFIDAQMKVKDESGRVLEFLDRETNVLKAFAKIILGEAYTQDIDALKVENKITPFSISDNLENVNMLLAANGGKAIMSQRESIENFGYSDDVDRTFKEITEEQEIDSFSLAQ